MVYARFIEKSYRRRKIVMAKQKAQTEYWKNKGPQFPINYWNNPNAIKRSKWFADILQNYDASSILEIGSAGGRNLKYIRDAKPDIKLCGLEVNANAVQFARKKLPDVEMFELNVYDLETIGKKFDLVFTSGVLIHLIPDTLPKILNKMIDRSNKYVMHIEQLGPTEIMACPDKKLKPKYKVSEQFQWSVDLVNLYKDLGYKTKVIPLPDEVKTNGASELIVVEL